MLDSNKSLYKDIATSIIPNWHDVDKNDLIREASKCKDETRKNALVAAIMLKYWGKISSFYYKAHYVATPEDVHGWLVMAVMYAVEKHPWDNPKSNIYNDPNGPDKVVNRVMESRRVTFYQQLNRYNRRINSDLLSLDCLEEDYQDVVMPETIDKSDMESDDIIKGLIKKKDYLGALCLFMIFYGGVFGKRPIVSLMRGLQNMDDEFLSEFATNYGCSIDRLKDFMKNFLSMSEYAIRARLTYQLSKFRLMIEGGELFAD